MAKSNEPVLVGAREFFREAEAHESDWREAWEDDLRFHALDQWPEAARAARNAETEAPRPCLTIDQTDQYVRQVLNDARLSPPALRASPVDDQADIRVAEDMQGLFRHIERVSRAQKAYLHALAGGVVIGRGWFRVYSEEIDRVRHFHEPRIGRIADWLSVYADPFSTELDGSDQTDAMLLADFSPGAFKRRWPDGSTVGSWDGGIRGAWMTSDYIRVAEWHSVRERKQKHIVLPDGAVVTPEDLEKANAVALSIGMPGIENFREETTTERVCTVRHVTEVEVLEEYEFHAPYCGLIPVYGNERYTRDGRKLFGMIRAAKDPQRLTNYLASNLAEAVNGQTKMPWLAPYEAIAQHEAEWARANVSNKAYLPYNHRDERGDPLPPPSRNNVDLQLPGFAQMMQMSHMTLQTTLGMYQASVGGKSNETSGVAIRSRKAESDVGTYHYIDNLSDSIQHAGRIIMAMIPKVYDTPRVARILGEDGSPAQVRIDPRAQTAFSETQNAQGDKVHVLNPTVGEYDVHVTVGPSYASQREETAATLAELFGRNPALMQIAGDIYFENLNFPGAQQLAKRLKAMLPDQVKALDDETEVPPEIREMLQRAMQALQLREQQIAQAMQAAQEVIQQSKDERSQAQVATAQTKAAEAQLAADRAQLEKVRADIQHLRELFERDKQAAMKDGQRMTQDIQRTAADVETRASQVQTGEQEQAGVREMLAEFLARDERRAARGNNRRVVHVRDDAGRLIESRLVADDSMETQS